jgi:hypothetical protein
MSARVLVWVLAVQLLLAAIFAYFAITGFPFLPHHAACTTTATASRCGQAASTSRTRGR